MNNLKCDNVSEFLEDDISCTRLKHHLLMLPDMIRTACSECVPIKKLTNLSTIAEIMETSNVYKGILTENDKLLRIYFTFPVTSATAERSFSSLRWLKTYLRSTMTNCRLNNQLLLYIHDDRTDKLDLRKIAKEFASLNQRRVNYFD